MAKLCALCSAAHANFLSRRATSSSQVTVFFSWLRSHSVPHCPLCRLFRKTSWTSTPVVLSPVSLLSSGETEQLADNEDGYLECVLGFSSDLKEYHCERHDATSPESLVGLFVDWNRTGKRAENESHGHTRKGEKSVDYMRLKQWLQECDGCSPQSTAWHIQHDTARRASVRLNLVDCRSRRVIQADWSYRFSALSYVCKF